MKRAKQESSLPTIISFILDRSGSMGECRTEVIHGFNNYIQKLQKDKKSRNTLFTLTTFDTESIDTPYYLTPVKLVKRMNKENFVPRGMTPLYDAVVETIEKMAEQVKENQSALVVIMTDGEENSSYKHDASCLKDLVEKLKKRGNWTFVFMGSNQDSWANASQWSFNDGCVADFAGGGGGMGAAFKSLGNATLNYCCAMNASAGDGGSSLNVSNFFSQEDKTSMKEAK